MNLGSKSLFNSLCYDELGANFHLADLARGIASSRLQCRAGRCAATLSGTVGYFARFSIRSLTTPGSAKVDVSPSAPKSFSAILRRIRRMILPDLVLGRPGAHWI